jgi:hypothetical protein
MVPGLALVSLVEIIYGQFVHQQRGHEMHVRWGFTHDGDVGFERLLPLSYGERVELGRYDDADEDEEVISRKCMDARDWVRIERT